MGGVAGQPSGRRRSPSSVGGPARSGFYEERLTPNLDLVEGVHEREPGRAGPPTQPGTFAIEPGRFVPSAKRTQRTLRPRQCYSPSERPM